MMRWLCYLVWFWVGIVLLIMTPATFKLIKQSLKETGHVQSYTARITV